MTIWQTIAIKNENDVISHFYQECIVQPFDNDIGNTFEF